LELQRHQDLHFAFEAGAEVAQAGVDAFLKGGELVVMGAVQHLLLDEAPQPFDQVQVGGGAFPFSRLKGKAPVVTKLPPSLILPLCRKKPKWSREYEQRSGESRVC
jgi:hypothetical protein